MQSFSIQVESANIRQASGHGKVEIQTPDPSVIIWKESGVWDDGYGSLEFFNVYRWSWLQNEKLRLEHLRYGEDNPVQLVELINSQKNHWETDLPYVCAKDTYSLTLKCINQTLFLKWKIKGPKKDQISTLCYS